MLVQVNSQKAKPFYDEICLNENDQDARWPHTEDCNKYYMCNEYDEYIYMDCPEDNPIFDTEYLICGEENYKNYYIE